MYLLTLLQFTSCSERGELTILTTKHGLLSSYTLRKVCFLTTNEFNWRAATQKVYFLTTDLRVIMASCWATRNICFVTTTHGYLPSLSFKTFFSISWWRRLISYSMSKVGRSKYMQHRRGHHALMMKFAPGVRGPNRWGNPSQSRLDYDCVTLRDLNNSLSSSVIGS